MELRSENYLSDRELTDRICGIKAPQQPVSRACRQLEAAGLIKRTLPPIKNYIPTSKIIHFDEQHKLSPAPGQSEERKPNAPTGQSLSMRNEFNAFWNRFWGTERDYYTEMPLEKLSLLKMAVSSIDHLITYETTVHAARMIADILEQDPLLLAQILHGIESADLNADGYDIECREGIPYICEVKAHFPAGGAAFDAVQRRQLEKDIHSLLYGKTKSGILPAELPRYYKFLCLYGGYNQVSAALQELISELDAGTGTKVEIYQNGQAIDSGTVYILIAGLGKNSLLVSDRSYQK